MATQKDNGVVIDERTKVPFLWMFTAIGATSLGLLFLYDIKTDVREGRKDTASLKKMMKESFVSKIELREWSDELRSKNDKMYVPHVNIIPPGAALETHDVASVNDVETTR